MSVLDLSALVYVLAQAADVVTTRRALARGGTRESNPRIRWLMERLGPTGWVLAKFALALAAAAPIYATGWWWLLLAAAGATGYYAWRNTTKGR